MDTCDTSDYGAYLHTEWALFTDDQQRAAVSREVFAGRQVDRVLDVGCGAGQELLPFSTKALCIGIDIANVGKIGYELFRKHQPQAKIIFAQASAEELPFQSGSFDVVICRLAIPYMDNARALREIARILAPGGAFLLKIHHARYYLRKFWGGLVAGELLPVVHAFRVLIAGLVYHLTGHQLRTHLLSRETFQTRWLLGRELKRCGLVIRRELPGSNFLTPLFLIEHPNPPEEGSLS